MARNINFSSRVLQVLEIHVYIAVNSFFLTPQFSDIQKIIFQQFSLWT